MTRNIDAPGIELREIDRSQYNRTDYSLSRSPVCLACGFADRGEDYTIQWINTKNNLLKIYNYPTNEAERYFYNYAIEILDRGGKCLMAKLPYDNKALNNYTYTDFIVNKYPTYISSDLQAEVAISNEYESQINSKYNKQECFEQKYSSKFIKDSIEYSINSKLSTKQYLQNFMLSARQFFDSSYVKIDGNNEYAGRCISTYNKLFNQTLSGVISSYNAGELLFTDEYNQIKSDSSTSSLINNKSLYQTFMSCFINPGTTVTAPSVMNQMYCSDMSSTFSSDLLSSYMSKEKKSSFMFDFDVFQEDKKRIESTTTYNEIWNVDKTLTSYIEIKSSTDDQMSSTPYISLKELDNLIINAKQLQQNRVKIVDITHSKYESTNVFDGEDVIKRECIGIIPLIVSPMNAMFFQELINPDNAIINDVEVATNLSNYNPVSTFEYRDMQLNDNVYNFQFKKLTSDDLGTQLSSNSMYQTTISKTISQMFPLIQYKNQEYLNRRYLKQIGVIVLKAYKDTANKDLVNFKIVESFVGSFDRNAVDEITNKSIFIDRLINESSEYIRFFSNVNIDENVNTLLIKNQTAYSLGFNSVETVKNIDVNKSIKSALNIIFKKANNPNTIPLDLVIDAGVSNIAQLIANQNKFEPKKDYVWHIDDYGGENNEWRYVQNKFDEFCRNTRQDCMFVADGLRPFCVIGNQKIVRPTDINSTVKNNILPNLKYMIGVNSSYTAGYCDWFYQKDDYSSDFFWCPPSIKAAGIMIYGDTYFQKWSAPAGHTRGIVNKVYDCAFSPTIEEAGKIYNDRWNYAINYPMNGIIMEGQKTMQEDMTALDRINVRRLMLYLEKQTIRICRRFLYEGNTAYLRQKFVDTLDPIFKDCQNKDGIVEYAIKCDDDINTPETIDRNELHCRIAIKPVKTIEYIVIDFIVTNQTANVSEEVVK